MGYQDKNYNGRRLDIPETETFSISSTIRSIKLNHECEIQLYKNDTDAAIVDSNTRSFEDLNSVSFVECSCYTKIDTEGCNTGCLCFSPDGTPMPGVAIKHCEGRPKCTCFLSNAKPLVTNTAGTTRVDYQERLGRYGHNCKWCKVRGRNW